MSAADDHHLLDPELGFAEQLERAGARGDELRTERGIDPSGRAAGAAVELRLRRLRSCELPEPELSELARRAHEGDGEALDRLLACLLPQVMRAARRYAGRDVELLDLVQEGVVGVLRALRRYDPGRGVPFPAYAGWWIRQAMQQAVAEQSRAVRLPAHTLWDIHELKEAREALTRERGRSPSDRELADRLEWGDMRLADVLAAERPALALDAPYGVDDGAATSYGELLESPASERDFEEAITRQTAHAVRTLLATLTERERQVLRWRFGLEGEGELSLRQIARRLGMSAERVRQIEQRALAKLHASAVPERLQSS